MAEICEDCGRALFAGNGYPAQDAAVCYGPHDSSCPRETIKRLRAQLASAQAELAERKRECEAWRALAGNRVAGYAVEFHCSGEEGTNSFEYVFGGEQRNEHKWIEVTSGSKYLAAIDLAQKLGLLYPGGETKGAG